MKCNECPNYTNSLCYQYLGESCGWQWITRYDDSWMNCKRNYDERELAENKIKNLLKEFE